MSQGPFLLVGALAPLTPQPQLEAREAGERACRKDLLHCMRPTAMLTAMCCIWLSHTCWPATRKTAHRLASSPAQTATPSAPSSEPLEHSTLTCSDPA